MVDHYNVLGVPRAATADEIKAAFRRAAKRVHPDAHASGTRRQQEEAQQRFIQLAQAYETLSHVGMRRAYDEKLKAGEKPRATAQPGAKASAGTSTQGAKPNPAHERQQRANENRRPSPDADRQARSDEQRKATEREAEGRQRRMEAERRERERAKREAEDLASRVRRSHAQAEAARNQTYGRPPRDRNVEDIVQDVESLLARFGLDLRTPIEVIWDTLLDWARRIFRDTEPVKPGRPKPEPSFRAKPRRPKAEASSEEPPRAKSPPPPKPPPRRRSSFRDNAEDAVFREVPSEPSVDRRAEDLELDRDLADLKRRMRESGRADAAGASKPHPKPSPTPEDEELAALKRKLGKE